MIQQKLFGGKVYFLLRTTQTKAEVKRLADRLRAGTYKPDNKPTKWRVRITPTLRGYRVWRR